ncbi:hypothetical protein [Croceicoccus sediminis]|uniref:hypothetical protein n=1 Tax=Croceicoccus sediminis TaxID=2571150 RepID=UPI00118278BC|nr:hypothetical protein [Croceicoccus sediminis]
MKARKFVPVLAAAMLAGAGACASVPQAATAQTATDSRALMPYADMADLATNAQMVAVVKVRKAVELDADRTGPVRQGWTRAYVEADTQSLLSGNAPIGAKVKYLADIPLDAKGRMAKIKKRTMVLFARPVPGKPGEVQLVAPDAQVPIEIVGDARLRTLLGEIVADAGAPVVTGVRDALHTPGNLAGEGETQIFLATEDGAPASIAVIRSPNHPVRWGLSTGELIDHGARPPERDTLTWYRLACALPAQLPASAQIATDPSLRSEAARDYAVVIEQLGPCGRKRVF